jgi:SAM-dependent methyltransferase
MRSPSGSVVSQQYWDASYEDLPLSYDKSGLLFTEMFRRLLPRGGSCLEIGCYPGNYLVFLGKELGYTVSGIDTTPFLPRLEAHLRAHDVEVGSLIREDFLAYETDARFDLVCSFGFIEHFPDFTELIRRHVALAKPGGWIVISCPNFRRLQRVAHSWLDRENLRRHVLAAMDLRAWRATFEAAGCEVVLATYYRTAEFWVDRPPNGRVRAMAAEHLRAAAAAIDARVDQPNRWTSPFMVAFARRA